MKTTKINFAGEEYHLAYNGTAFFELQDIEDIFTAMKTDFSVFCRVIKTLTEQGELVRRYQGYDSGTFIRPEQLTIEMSALDVIELRKAAADAILAGMKREVEGKKKTATSASKNLKRKPATAMKN